MPDHSIATQHRQTAEGWTPSQLPAAQSNLPTLPDKSPKNSRLGPGKIVSMAVLTGFLGILCLELFGGPEMSPLSKFGESLARFTEEAGQGQMRVQICLAKQQEIAQRLAKLEADYAEWRGTCGLVEFGARMLNQSAGDIAGGICDQGSREYFQTAINDLHQSRRDLGECG